MAWIAAGFHDGQLHAAFPYLFQRGGIQRRTDATVLVVRMDREQVNLAGLLLALQRVRQKSGHGAVHLCDQDGIFLQVFDEGRLTDQRGRTINFCNTIIIMTSNLAVDYDEILKHVEEEKEMAGEGWAIDEDMVEREKICDKLQEYFRPEFLNRIDEIVVFNPLQKEVLRAIAGLNIDSFLKRLREEKAIEMQVEDDVIELILKYGYNPRYGARPLKRAVQRFLINSFAQRMLEVEFKPGDKVYATLQGEKVIFRKEGETPMEDERNDLDDDGGDEDFLNRTCGPER
ncbi:MAG: Chaperone protein ClpB [bacterium ADurb.Bin363]|nr:MAG: Chaperone protein ClpB [bacterium ADurb.Bin363]